MSATTEQWLAEHKGPLLDVIAEVWWCGDDECDCTQAQIVERYRNLKAPRFVVRLADWKGEFHTGGAGGAEEELAAQRAHLLRTNPGRAAEIKWPSDLAQPHA